MCAFGLAGVVGCQSSEKREKLTEFARIARAVDQVRAAPHNKKRSFTEALKAEECSRLCDLHRLCVDAYSLHSTALLALEEARLLSGGSDPKPAARALDQAEQMLKRARVMTRDCAALQAKHERALSTP